MNFSLTDEQSLLVDTLTRVLAEDGDFAQRLQRLRAGDGRSPALWARLLDLGLAAAVLPESLGGLGGATELTLLARCAGRALLLEPLESTLATHLLLGRLAAASATAEALLDDGGFVLAAVDGLGTAVSAERLAHGWRLHGTLPLVVDGERAQTLLVALDDTGYGIGTRLVKVRLPAEGVLRTPFITVDGRRAADVHFTAVEVSEADQLGGAEAVALAADASLLAQGADTLGSCERALELTTEYLRTRQQFGGPIGRFQALQHRLVHCLGRLEELRTAVMLGAARFDGAPIERRRAMAALGVVQVECARHLGEEAVQLHGGMGVTDDMEISHHFRRLTAATLRHGGRDEHLQRYASLGTSPTPG